MIIKILFYPKIVLFRNCNNFEKSFYFCNNRIIVEIKQKYISFHLFIESDMFTRVFNKKDKRNIK